MANLLFHFKLLPFSFGCFGMTGVYPLDFQGKKHAKHTLSALNRGESKAI